MKHVLLFVTGCRNSKKAIHRRRANTRYNPEIITNLQILAVRPNGGPWRKPLPSAAGPENYSQALETLHDRGWRIEYNGFIRRGDFLENPGVFLDDRFCPIYVNDCKLVRATKETQ
jgi:hypothetical protein